MIKLLTGGSPCTYWSIAQKNNRETQAEGLGWELFKNYLIAKEKFKPDFFLYENNKSASQAIKDQIKQELGVWDGTLFTVDNGVRYIEINSALVSAQNRQRFYVHNCGEVQQPTDRQIHLCDILENGVGQRQQEKSRTITAGYIACSQRDMRMDIETDGFMGKQGVIEPINVCQDKESHTIKTQYFKNGTANFVTNGCHDATGVAETASKTKVYNSKNIYCVKNGLIGINDKQYPTDLEDGDYTIRKLTVKECCRLQTMPDDYMKSVSASQGYKGIGNGWTAEVIIHILNYALKDVPKDEGIVVLSMYDGIGTGRYCLDKMGFTNVKYYAYEIDKYAMTVAKDNYPDIIECGDAFQVRNGNWKLTD